MSRRSMSLASGGLVLLALCAHLMSTVFAFTTGQAATLVLGQPNFTSSATAKTASGMNNPAGVALDPTTGKVFVADTSNSRVLRFASLGSLANGAAAEGVLGQVDFTSNAIATTASGMNYPSGVTVDSAGRLWVTDYYNSRVLRFDGAASKANGASADGVLGQANFTGNATATTASGMSAPLGVTLDSAGRLWVADSGNSRVLRFDGAAAKANGAAADNVLGQTNFTSQFGATTVSRMSNPYGVLVDSAGTLWVADTSNQRVLRFDGAAAKANGASADGLLGQATFTSSAPATSASGMNGPVGLVLDSTGRLWVADSSNNRVLAFDGAAAKANGAAADSVLGQTTFTSNAPATTVSGLSSPASVAVDSADNLWVADRNNSRVLLFDPNGLPPPTSTPTSFPTSVPTGVPTLAPTGAPTTQPTLAPTGAPTTQPTLAPTGAPTTQPTLAPTGVPSTQPTLVPTGAPTTQPTATANPTPQPGGSAPLLSLSFQTGAPSSAFVITGVGYPAGGTVSITINGQAVGTPVTVRSDGTFALVLATAPSAGDGFYVVAAVQQAALRVSRAQATAATGALSNFQITRTGPGAVVRTPPAGTTATTVSVPATIAPLAQLPSIALPLVTR